MTSFTPQTLRNQRIITSKRYEMHVQFISLSLSILNFHSKDSTKTAHKHHCRNCASMTGKSLYRLSPRSSRPSPQTIRSRSGPSPNGNLAQQTDEDHGPSRPQWVVIHMAHSNACIDNYTGQTPSELTMRLNED